MHMGLYPQVVLAFQHIPGCMVLLAYDNLHMFRLNVLLLVLVYHTLSHHQDSMLGDKSSTAGQEPECGLLWGPLLVCYDPSRGRVGAHSVIRWWADINGCVPRPLSVGEVVSAESVKFATNCDIREDKEQKRIKFYSADVKVALKLESSP